MKTSFKVITAIFALGLVILVGLHLFLQYGLTKTMREVVLPQLKAETGIDAQVGRLSLNVAKGTLHLKDIGVKNPEGFLLENLASVKQIDVEVSIPSLFKQKLIQVRHIQVQQALINVVRNKDGEVNLNKLQESLSQRSIESQPVPEVGVGVPDRGVSSEEPGVSLPERTPEEIESSESKPFDSQMPEVKPLPELLIEAIQCKATVRYIDLKLNQLDIALNLNIIGNNISTQKEPGTPWGDISIIGALGNNRAQFITDLALRLAPLTDPENPSFDLIGKVMEIDPRIMDKLYNELGIRSAPFGFEPEIFCREGWFQNSSISLNLNDVTFEDKLAKRLGGMASMGQLRFPVAIEGSLQEPRINIQDALYGAIGGNAQTVLNSFLKGVVAKETGMDVPPEDLAEAAVEVLAAHVDEIGESETIKKVLKDLTDGKPADTNAPPEVTTDVLIDILGEQVDEIGENEELKDELKNLGKFLFGK
jgi:hypothetical protein